MPSWRSSMARLPEFQAAPQNALLGQVKPRTPLISGIVFVNMPEFSIPCSVSDHAKPQKSHAHKDKD